MQRNVIESKFTFSSLAKEIGVTTSVVSRVLKNTSTTIAIGENTKRKVLDLAWKKGFRLNNNIGFMAPKSNMTYNLLYYPVTTGILEKCATLNLGVFNSTFDNNDNAEIPEFLLKREVSGVIFLDRIPSNIKNYLQTEMIPFVVINPSGNDIENDCVLFNDYAAMTELLDYLDGNGYREYICITYDNDSNYYRELSKSFNDFLNAKLRKGTLLLSKSDEEIELLPEIKSMVESASPKTVFIASGRLFTMKLLEFAAINGKAIPNDLGIVGNNLIADYYIPKLTTVFYPFYESGVMAVNTIVEKWEKKEFSIAAKTVCGKLIKNESTERRK